MSEASSMHFGSIRDDYAFFLQHSTEAAADLHAYAPHFHGLAMGDESYRMLDFCCGDGGFTAKFLVQSQWLPERLWLAIVEPDASSFTAAGALPTYPAAPDGVGLPVFPPRP